MERIRLNSARGQPSDDKKISVKSLLLIDNIKQKQSLQKIVSTVFVQINKM